MLLLEKNLARLEWNKLVWLGWVCGSFPDTTPSAGTTKRLVPTYLAGNPAFGIGFCKLQKVKGEKGSPTENGSPQFNCGISNLMIMGGVL